MHWPGRAGPPRASDGCDGAIGCSLQGGAPGRERVQLVNISTITFGLMNGGYIYSSWGLYTNKHITGGGTTL